MTADDRLALSHIRREIRLGSTSLGYRCKTAQRAGFLAALAGIELRACILADGATLGGALGNAAAMCPITGFRAESPFHGFYPKAIGGRMSHMDLSHGLRSALLSIAPPNFY